MEENYYVFTFYSTHLALEFEKKLKNNDLKIKLIPVPRQISSSCGLAGRVKKEDLGEIKNYCEENQFEYDNIYQIFSEQDPKQIV